MLVSSVKDGRLGEDVDYNGSKTQDLQNSLHKLKQMII